MRSLRPLSIFVTILVAILGRGEPVERMIPATARWVFTADIAALKQSETGSRLIRHLQSGPSSNQIVAMSALFRVDPFNDIERIILWGQPASSNATILLLQGRFDAAHLETIIRGNARYQSLAYGRHTLHSWVDEGNPEVQRQYGCIHPTGGLLVSRSRVAVEEALDTLDGRRPPMNPLESFGFPFSSNAPLYYASGETVPTGIPLPDPTRMAIRATWIEASEKVKTVHITLGLQVSDPDSARQVRDVVLGLVALGQMAQDPDTVELMAPARVDLEGTSVRISTSASSDLVFRMLQKQLDGPAAGSATASTP
jgi:hypothetical protein